MNYIKHLNATFIQFYGDSRLHPGHISLYMALFFYWNLHRFAEEFRVNRDEIMKMAGIGSRTTFHRLIKNLSEWDYIDYIPSRSPKRNTMVKMYQIWTGTSTNTEQTSTIMKRYGVENGPPTLYNKQRQTNKLYKKERPISQLETINYFKLKKWPEMEAVKFFNHYQGIGWKTGKVPIRDWKAIAENWMLKSEEIRKSFASPNLKKFTDNLKVQNRKDYGEPL